MRSGAREPFEEVGLVVPVRLARWTEGSRETRWKRRGIVDAFAWGLHVRLGGEGCRRGDVQVKHEA